MPWCSWSCFLSAEIHSDTRDMVGFISGRSGLCGTSAGITTWFPAKIFTMQLLRICSKYNYPYWWRTGGAMHHPDGNSNNGGLCNIQGEKENIQTYVCLLFWQGNVDGHARTLHYTGQLLQVCPCCWFDFFSSLTGVLLWLPYFVINHSIRVGTVSWHHSRYISNREPVFD